MKPVQAPQTAPEAPVKVAFQVQFGGGPKGRRRASGEAPTSTAQREAGHGEAEDTALRPAEQVSFGRLPKITQLLVLGHHFENLVRNAVMKDYAEIARLSGLSRARITQMANLALLAPEIQEVVLSLPAVLEGREPLTEHDLRHMVAEVPWQQQRCTCSTLRRCGHYRPVQT